MLRRRLFWKIYLTMLASLVLVGLLLGTAWRIAGDRLWERWMDLRVQLADAVVDAPKSDAEAVGRALDRVADEGDLDVTVYRPDGSVLVARGETLDLDLGRTGPRRGPRRIMRIDLPDGRIVLARPPPPEPLLRSLMMALLVAGGVGLAAYPVTRRLTKRLEDLRGGVELWGDGSLATRVVEEGSDEIASVGRTFNKAAARIEALIASQKSLLANASHELRSPLARLRMAVEMGANSPSRSARDEIARNLQEIDQLVEEILLASRLDRDIDGASARTRVDLLGLAAEEAARSGAAVSGDAVEVEGDATLLRRLIRNLLENAAKHGAPPVEVVVRREGAEAVLTVTDKGEGIPPAERERVFEPFYRPSGRSEAMGGWGLGLSLVRQIASHHGGRVSCGDGPGAGAELEARFPLAPAARDGTGASSEPRS
jgi:signal transduction histidine kinase